MNFHKICVLGLGYIGLPTASTFAKHGIQIIGVDVNPHVLNELQNGRLHIYEPGLGELVKAAVSSGRMIIRSTPEEADAFIIAVPTPFYGDKLADLSFVKAAAQAIVPVLRKGNLVVLESTSPPLTTRDIVAPILESSGLKAGIDFHLAYSPERVLPGQILRELIENTRIIGGFDSASAEAGQDLYSIFVKGDILLTDATTAEMVKLMENTYRDVNIAIANEFSRLADRFKIDVWEAISLANRHPRVRILNPGPGVGGHCISVDPWFLVEAAPDLTPLIHTARKVNDSQPEFVLKWIENSLGSLKGKKITALGLAYKPDVDDLRESPAVEVAHLLVKAGVDITVFEPYKLDFCVEGAHTAATLDDAILHSDALVLLVGHKLLKSMDPKSIGSKVKTKVVLDCTNSLDPLSWQKEGFRVFRMGVGE